MTSSESEGQPPPKKRSRPSGNGYASKKARGRPRVDTEDATAADRRRTQIRLAQRAYRQRKETTIASLKEENTQLQNIIEQMNKSFLKFSETAFESGLLQLSPNLAHELKQVTETFVTLAKSASEGDHDDEEMSEDPLDPATEWHNAAAALRLLSEPNKSKKSPVPVATHTEVGWGYTATLAKSPPIPTSLQHDVPPHSTFFAPLPSSYLEGAKQTSLIPAGRPFTMGQLWDQSRSQTQGRSDPQSLPFGLVDILPRDEVREYSDSLSNPQIYSVQIPTPGTTPPQTRFSTPPWLSPPTTKTLSIPWTYSHEETSYARRLTRAAVETGFHLLSSANIRSAALNYVFRLTLPYLSPDTLRERFKLILSRGVGEDLDYWDSPFLHLGGAGTHYPRRDAQGSIVPPPASWTIRTVGPLPAKRIRAENNLDPSKSHDLDVDMTGFEGEWFDAFDVQGYLEEKGCHIDSKDSFVEVLIETDDEDHASQSPGLSTGSSDTYSSSSRSTPNHEPAFSQSDAPFGLDMVMNMPNNSFTPDFGKMGEFDPSTIFDQPLGLDLAPGFAMGINSGFGSLAFGNMASLDLGIMEPLPVVKQKKKKVAWIDVSKLTDELIKHGICLGRSPGFRRKDVDTAFQTSLVMAD